MDKPTIADTKPVRLELEPGTYFFCTCGKSSKQPFCDGQHRGSGFAPQRFEVTEKRTMALCACKHSGRGHLCDGSHKDLK